MRPNLEKIFLIALFGHLLLGTATFSAYAFVAARDNPWSLVPRVAADSPEQKLVESKAATLLRYVVGIVWVGGLFITPIQRFGFGFVFSGMVLTSIFWGFVVAFIARTLAKAKQPNQIVAPDVATLKRVNAGELNTLACPRRGTE